MSAFATTEDRRSEHPADRDERQRARLDGRVDDAFAIITRIRFGVAAYVGRIVPWANSHVRLIAATTPNSITLMTDRSGDHLGEVVPGTVSGSLPKTLTRTVTITGNATAGSPARSALGRCAA